MCLLRERVAKSAPETIGWEGENEERSRSLATSLQGDREVIHMRCERESSSRNNGLWESPSCVEASIKHRRVNRSVEGFGFALYGRVTMVTAGRSQ